MTRRSDETRFDRYVVVDWSAAGRPRTGTDSIWIADLDAGDLTSEGAMSSPVPELLNPPTRHDAEAILSERLTRSAEHGRRTLVAVDAPLGYPAGSAAYFGVGDATTPAWIATWRLIADRLDDDRSNASNRFEVAGELNGRGGADGPFWGCPAGRTVDGLAQTKPATFAVPEFRHCERWLRDRGLRPASCWQLMGAGSVGSQTLTLLPILERLVGRGGVEVWPFTTGLRAPAIAPGTAVVAETWPTAFDVSYPVHWIRDAAQVHDVALALRAADESAQLGVWFTPAHGGVLPEIEQEEGWAVIPPTTPAGRTVT